MQMSARKEREDNCGKRGRKSSKHSIFLMTFFPIDKLVH